MSIWNTTHPPRRKQKPVWLRYTNDNDLRKRIYKNEFVWSIQEGAWVQCDAPDGVALYPEDGWRVLEWK